MKICLILEGSYPYVKGGVSNWAHGFISNLPEYEFIIWTISDQENKRGKFCYTLPKNVVLVQETFLDTALNLRTKGQANIKYSPQEIETISELMRCDNPNWAVLHSLFSDQGKNPIDFLMSEDFLTILKRFCKEEFPFAGFVDLFWTTRSMFLPLFHLLGQPMPIADLYHSASTGYAGVMGSLISMKYHKPYVLTEHGIYTREREEEILRSDWVIPYLKDLWISMFYMYSKLAYKSAHRVTSLFSRASLIQQEIGCSPDKCEIIGNGIVFEDFANIPQKSTNGWIDIGAIVRFAPIKDIKTLIYTFSLLKQEINNVRLHILGGIDDEEYYQECLSLINYLNLNDVIIAGVVDVREYLRNIDFIALTSISEGQPFAILESLAASRSVIATNVGGCRELLEGDVGDHFGTAGICVPPMHQTKLLEALIDMCQNPDLRLKMGKVGQQRIKKYYNQRTMINNYLKVYEEAIKTWQASGLN